jgi:hypothetical protein
MWYILLIDPSILSTSTSDSLVCDNALYHEGIASMQHEQV